MVGGTRDVERSVIAVGTESGLDVVGVEGGQDTERVEVGLHARRGA